MAVVARWQLPVGPRGEERVVDTFQAIAVVALALLPGALYMWAREQRTGRWGVGLADRLLRFVGASALLHVFLAPLTYYLYGELVRSGRVARGEPLSLWYWLLAVGYVIVPIAAGRLVGTGVRRNWRWVRWIGDTHPAPRAWDFLFARDGLAGWVILRTRDDRWLGGFWAEADRGGLQSYASGYPDVQELFLVEQFGVDDGKIVVDQEGDPVMLGRGLLVRWDEIAYLEFIQATAGAPTPGKK
jgi:hypothetical protein